MNHEKRPVLYLFNQPFRERICSDDSQVRRDPQSVNYRWKFATGSLNFAPLFATYCLFMINNARAFFYWAFGAFDCNMLHSSLLTIFASWVNTDQTRISGLGRWVKKSRRKKICLTSRKNSLKFASCIKFYFLQFTYCSGLEFGEVLKKTRTVRFSAQHRIQHNVTLLHFSSRFGNAGAW